MKRTTVVVVVVVALVAMITIPVSIAAFRDEPTCEKRNAPVLDVKAAVLTLP